MKFSFGKHSSLLKQQGFNLFEPCKLVQRWIFIESGKEIMFGSSLCFFIYGVSSQCSLGSHSQCNLDSDSPLFKVNPL